MPHSIEDALHSDRGGSSLIRGDWASFQAADHSGHVDRRPHVPSLAPCRSCRLARRRLGGAGAGSTTCRRRCAAEALGRGDSGRLVVGALDRAPPATPFVRRKRARRRRSTLELAETSQTSAWWRRRTRFSSSSLSRRRARGSSRPKQAASCSRLYAPRAACAVLARTTRSAKALAGARPPSGPTLVVTRLAGPAKLPADLSKAASRRIVALTALKGKRFTVKSWQRAVSRAATSSSLDLSVAATGTSAPTQLGRYLSLLSSQHAADATPSSSHPPAPPAGSPTPPTSPSPGPSLLRVLLRLRLRRPRPPLLRRPRPHPPRPSPSPSRSPAPGHPTPPPAPAPPAPCPARPCPALPVPTPPLPLPPAPTPPPPRPAAHSCRSRRTATTARASAATGAGRASPSAEPTRSHSPATQWRSSCGSYPSQPIVRGAQSQNGPMIAFRSASPHCAKVSG